MEYANFYFAYKLRKYDDKIGKFKKDKEVKFVEKYINKLGYKNFVLKTINKQKNIYEIVFEKGGKNIEITKASSGEKEIINLLLGIFAFNIYSGVVIIDEPDLHLHPRWQKLLLQLFNELSKERKIQFLIVTHSPQFITYKTIKNTFRVYKDKDTGSSKIFIPSDKDLKKQNIKDVFQIINTLNNEKIFFADKVILVEGVVDRIIFEKILKILQEIENNNEVIDIIDVYGKTNFKKFKDFLEIWKIQNFIIADLDYISEIGNADIKKLFEVDFNKINDSLKDKNSKDGVALLKSLDSIFKKNKSKFTKDDIQNLKDLFKYIKNRHVVLKNDINDEDKKKLNSFIESQYPKGIYILKKGEIEKYFSVSYFDIQKAIEVVKKINNNIEEEFKMIIKKIFE